MEAIQLNDQQPFQNSAFFSTDHFLKLQGIMVEVKVQKGTILFQDGDPVDQFYYVKQGAVKLTKVAENQKVLLLCCYGPGDFFGELGLAPQVNTSNMEAEAVCDSVLGVIRQSALESLLNQTDGLTMTFAKWMGYMQRFTQVKMQDLLLYGKNGALASTLVRMANTFGIWDGQSIRFSVHFTNSELGHMIGASRETVNRMLHQLQKQGIIDFIKTEIVICDLKALKERSPLKNYPVEMCRL